MEPLEPTSAEFKLSRWLLLLSVITLALGGIAWCNSRSEQLKFVEPIWSDSLAGHEKHTGAAGQRRKIGEVWSISRASGFTFWGRGQSRELEGRYPVFTPANAFQQAVTDQLLAELRECAANSTKIEWSDWWACVKERPKRSYFKFRQSYQLLFVSDQAVTLHDTEADEVTWGRNFVNREGLPHEVQVGELFNGVEWQDVFSDLIVADLIRQGINHDKWRDKPLVDDRLRAKNFLVGGLEGLFVLLPDRVRIHVPQLSPFLNCDVYDLEIPLEKLTDHLRPDGPHRLFQTKVSE